MARKIVTRWDDISQQAEKGVDIWVAVDVHTKKHHVAVMSANGVVHDFVMPANNQLLLEQFASRNIKIKALVYEAGLTGFALARLCQQHDVPVVVVAPNKIPQPSGVSAKTDRLDCLKLVSLLACGMLKPIAIPTPEQEARRALVRRREQLVKSGRQVKQRIKSFLVLHAPEALQGTSSFSAAFIGRLKQLQLQPELRSTLNSYLRELDFINQEKSGLENEISASVMPAQDVLSTVPGVALVVSSCFRTEIFDPHRFASANHLVSFIGLAPCIRQSGESKGRGHLAASGQSYLRSLLIEAAWVLRKKAPWAARFYQRVKQRSGKWQSAIVALARKLAILLWRLMLENRPYQENYN